MTIGMTTEKERFSMTKWKAACTLTAAFIGGASFALTAAAMMPAAQDAGDDQPFDQEMMQRWMEASTPGEPHAHLQKMVGTWEYTVRSWMSPDAEPTESTGTATYEMMLGGRFLKAEYEGEVMGSPFEGFEVMGYDNTREEYIAVWMDNMSTTMMLSRGEYDEENDRLVMRGTVDDVMRDKRDAKFRTVTTMPEDDRAVYEMYVHGPDGKEFKTLEVVSERR